MSTKKSFGQNTRHGTQNAYSNFGCRCDMCREANTEKMRLYRMTEEGKESNRKQAKVARIAERLMAKWLKENEPEVYVRLRDEAKATVYGV